MTVGKRQSAHPVIPNHSIWGTNNLVFMALNSGDVSPCHQLVDDCMTKPVSTYVTLRFNSASYPPRNGKRLPAVVVFCGLEGNRGLGVALAVR